MIGGVSRRSHRSGIGLLAVVLRRRYACCFSALVSAMGRFYAGPRGSGPRSLSNKARSGSERRLEGTLYPLGAGNGVSVARWQRIRRFLEAPGRRVFASRLPIVQRGSPRLVFQPGTSVLWEVALVGHSRLCQSYGREMSPFKQGCPRTEREESLNVVRWRYRVYAGSGVQSNY